MYQLIKRRIHTSKGELVIKDKVLASSSDFHMLQNYTHVMPDTLVLDPSVGGKGLVISGVKRSDN